MLTCCLTELLFNTAEMSVNELYNNDTDGTSCAHRYTRNKLLFDKVHVYNLQVH